MKEIPDITITTQDARKIPYEEAYTVWNGKMFKRIELFPSGKTLPAEAVLVNYGETVFISFPEPYPDEIITTSQVFLYDEASDYFQKSPSLEEQLIKNEHGQYTLELTHEGTVAYFLSVQWENNVCEYTFLLLTSPTEENSPSVSSTITPGDPTVSTITSSTSPTAASTSQNAPTTSSDPDSVIRSRFRSLGLTFHEASSSIEQKWIDHVKTDFQKNGVTVNPQTVLYIEKINERSFTINYPNQNGGTSTPTTTSSSATSLPSATGIYAKPYDTNAIIDDVWVYAKSKGFWLDTSRQKNNSSWNNPVKTNETSDLKRDLYLMIDMEVERGVGKLNIVVISNANGEYTFYFFA